MTNATISQLNGIEDPSLRSFAEGVADGIIAAGLKAAAHHADPKQLALAKGDSLERAFLTRLRALPLERQKQVASKSLPVVLEKRVKGLEGVDLRGASPVFDLAVSKLKLGPIKKDSTIAKRISPVLEDGAAGFRQQNSPDQLQFHLLSVKCIDETDGFLGSEAGSDEIALGGLMVDAGGNTIMTPRFNIGSFGEDGATKNFNPPRQFGVLDFRSGSGWPKSFNLMLTLVEVDNGGFPELLEKIYREATAKVKDAVTGMIPDFGTTIGEAIANAIDWIFEKVLGWIKDWWQDDVFKPVTMTFGFGGADWRWDGKSETDPLWIDWRGHGGRYKLWFKAKLAVAAEAAQAAGAIVYQHANFGGSAVTLPVGHYPLAQLRARGVANDSISSIKVGAGMRMIAYQHDNFGGSARMFTGAVSYVGNDFNDQASSIVIEPMQVMLFEHADFGGRSQGFGPGRYDVGQLAIGNDQVSSVLVPPGYKVTLFGHAGFKGAKKVLTSDTRYVGNDFNDIVSSLIVELA